MGNNDVFAVIADKTRRGILTALKDGERPVGELVDELGVSQPTVSKHLRILRDAGMVSMEAQGQRRLYAVRPEPLAEVTEWVHDVVGRTAGPVEAPAAVDTAATVPETEGAATDVPESAEHVPVAPGILTEVPSPPPSPAAEEEAVPVRQELAPYGPGLSEEDAPPRAGRGAGARAVGLLAGLPGFRRRPRDRRR